MATIRVIGRRDSACATDASAGLVIVVSDLKAGLSLLMVMPHPGPNRLRTRRLLTGIAGLLLASLLVASGGLRAAASLQTPDQFIGFKVGSDNKLVRWDKIVEYMK